MRRNRWLLAATPLTLGALVLTGCAVTTAQAETTNTNTPEAATYAQQVLDANADATTLNDDEWDAAAAVTITLDGTTASADGDGVTIDGSTVTITATGTYVLTGELKGQVIVAAPDDAVVALVLDGATIASTSASAIDIETADDAVISLTGVNSLSSSADVATVHADADLTISGDGSLTVESAADGISTSDDLVVLSGAIDVTAADDALRGKDALVVEGGTINVDAGGEGLTSDQTDDPASGYVWISGGTVTVAAGDDAIKGETDVVVTGGEVTVTDSYEGIEAVTVVVSGGTVDVTSSDDGLNASSGTEARGDDGSVLVIEGGDVTIDAQGDGFDSNGSASVTGGRLTVWGPTNDGNGALDVNGTFTVDGGTILAVGSAGMAVSPSGGAQGFVAAMASGSAGGEVQIVDADGSIVASFTAVKEFASIVFSSADLTEGAEYTVLVNGTSAGTATEGVALAGGMGGPQGGPPQH